jgi:hypothetical protein
MFSCGDKLHSENYQRQGSLSAFAAEDAGHALDDFP